MCISLLKPLTCTRCRHWKLHIISKAWMLDPPAILCDTFHKYIIAPWVSQVQGLSMLSTLTHTLPPPTSIFSHQYSPSGAGLNCVRSADSAGDGLSFLRFLGPTSKTQRLKQGISEQLESLFNYVRRCQACHQRVVTPLRLLSGRVGQKASLAFLMKMFTGSLLFLLQSHQTIEGQVKPLSDLKGKYTQPQIVWLK